MLPRSGYTADAEKERRKPSTASDQVDCSPPELDTYVTEISMMNTGDDIRTLDSVHSKTVDALVAYLMDCQFNESQLNEGNLVMAIEAVYEPHPRFWRDLSLTCVVDAVVRVFPDWEPSRRKAPRRVASLMRGVEEVLELNAFDEANAEMLGSLPKHKRLVDRTSAADWIVPNIVAKGR